jgi:hypothetical protein
MKCAETGIIERDYTIPVNSGLSILSRPYENSVRIHPNAGISDAVIRDIVALAGNLMRV